MCIITSDDILDLPFSKYLSTEIGQVIFFFSADIAPSISNWAYQNRIEKIEYKLSAAIPETKLDIYKAMIGFCDKVAFFWSEEKDDCYAAILFAQELGIKNIVHIIEKN